VNSITVTYKLSINNENIYKKLKLKCILKFTIIMWDLFSLDSFWKNQWDNEYKYNYKIR